MTAAFFITLREGLEAALIVGIIAAYLVKVDRRDAMRGVWIGVAAALALSVIVGAIVVATVGRLPLAVQETVEGLAAVLAVIVLTWMLFWMRRQGRAMKGELEHGVELALAAGSAPASRRSPSWRCRGRAWRRSCSSSPDRSPAEGAAAPSSAIAGLVAAVGLGYAIFAAGVRIDLRRFFTITGVVLIFVAAGLSRIRVHEFGEAGISRTPGVFDLSALSCRRADRVGSMLAGMFGYRAAPTVLELFGYLAYLIPVLFLFTAPSCPPASAGRQSSARGRDDPRSPVGIALGEPDVLRPVVGRRCPGDAVTPGGVKKKPPPTGSDVLLERLPASRPGPSRSRRQVALVGDEEQPLIELASLVEASAERVAAAQDPVRLAAARPRVGQPDVGVERDDRAVRVDA